MAARTPAPRSSRSRCRTRSYALPAYYIVAPAEASSNLARYDGVRYGLRVPGKDIADLYEETRAEGFGREVKRRIMIGTYVLSAGYYDAYYVRAQKIRTLIKRDFEEAYAAGRRRHPDARDARPRPSASARRARADPVEMYLNDVFTVTVNMAGPARHRRAGRARRPGPAARPAAHRPRPSTRRRCSPPAQVIEDAAGRTGCRPPGGLSASPSGPLRRLDLGRLRSRPDPVAVRARLEGRPGRQGVHRGHRGVRRHAARRLAADGDRHALARRRSVATGPTFFPVRTGRRAPVGALGLRGAPAGGAGPERAGHGAPGQSSPRPEARGWRDSSVDRRRSG